MLYKYRSIRDFKYFVDIILKRRLYTSPYFDLNDPMEGQYLYNQGELSKELVRAIKGEKEKFRICSLSKEPEHPLMWAHYADGHHGVVIGVTVNHEKYDVRPVIYSDALPSINTSNYISMQTAKDILCHKVSVWEYDKEERVFIDRGMYVKVNIKEIRLGSKMKQDDQDLLRELIERVSPNISVTDSISAQPY